jgi:tetratricopeptide (TPR) repeat protein
VEGQNAFAAGEYQKAIDLFRRVDDLAPRAELEYNIALAYDQLKDPAAALAAYRSYLRRAPDSPDRAEVEAQIVRLERQLGKTLQQQLTVVTEPAGATLLVNAVPVGFSPWTGELPTGRHQLVARQEGRLQAVREVSLTAEQAVQVTLTLPVDAALIAEREAALRRERELQVERERPTGLERIRPLTWGIVGAGAAGLVGAAAFEQARANSEDDARLSQTQLVAEQEIERAQTHQTTSQVLLGVGVGAAVLGGVFVYIDLTRPDEKQTRLGAGCATRGCSVFARGRF